MPKTKKFQTNFSGGELSDLIEGRPDLAKYYTGARTLENVLLYPEGGAFRRPGLLRVAEVKTSADKTIVVPFEFNVAQAYMLEFGDQYVRLAAKLPKRLSKKQRKIFEELKKEYPDDAGEIDMLVSDPFVQDLIAQAKEQGKRERDKEYKPIFEWLCGERGDFPNLAEKPHYRFRTELREKLKAPSPKSDKE